MFLMELKFSITQIFQLLRSKFQEHFVVEMQHRLKAKQLKAKSQQPLKAKLLKQRQLKASLIKYTVKATTCCGFQKKYKSILRDAFIFLTHDITNIHSRYRAI